MSKLAFTENRCLTTFLNLEMTHMSILYLGAMILSSNLLLMFNLK